MQIDTHRGVTVFLPTLQDLVEHYEIRVALEMLAVEKVAEHFQAQDAPPLAACLANDPVRAANAVRRHLEQTVTHVMNVLEQAGKA